MDAHIGLESRAAFGDGLANALSHGRVEHGRRFRSYGGPAPSGPIRDHLNSDHRAGSRQLSEQARSGASGWRVRSVGRSGSKEEDQLRSTLNGMPCVIPIEPSHQPERPNRGGDIDPGPPAWRSSATGSAKPRSLGVLVRLYVNRALANPPRVALARRIGPGLGLLDVGKDGYRRRRYDRRLHALGEPPGPDWANQSAPNSRGEPAQRPTATAPSFWGWIAAASTSSCQRQMTRPPSRQGGPALWQPPGNGKPWGRGHIHEEAPEPIIGPGAWA